MIAEVLSIGTELLMGQTLNTNAQFLSRRLSALGITQHHQSTVGDNPKRLRQAYKTALSRADVVITSGGLGPTGDDITKQVLADLLNVPLEQNAEAFSHVESFFKTRGREMSENNLAQTLFTRDSIILPNPNGTAPGAIVPCDALFGGKAVIHLPGPPYELEPMFDSFVAPYLEKRSGQSLVSRYIRIFGMGESDVDMRLRDLMAYANPSLSPYCSLGETQLRATALCSSKDEGESMLAPLIESVKARLGDVIYAITDTDRGSLAETTLALLKDKRLTCCACESLTGGQFSSALVAVPGASDVFLGGLITYTDLQKQNLAGVRKDTLINHGAVSEACAKEMAQGALKLCNADIAVSLTGCAGPGSDSRGTPIGLVIIGIASKERSAAHVFHLSGSRSRILTLSTLNALNLLRLEALSIQ